MQHDNSRCMHCAGCSAICPTNAITVYETFIDIDGNLCTKCGNCVALCPTGALSF